MEFDQNRDHAHLNVDYLCYILCLINENKDSCIVRLVNLFNHCDFLTFVKALNDHKTIV